VHVGPKCRPARVERLTVGALWDPFLDNLFMQRALAAGLLVSIACGIVGTFVVLRGMAFLGDALAHGVLPGIAGALVIGVPTLAGAAVGAAVMIGGVTLVTRRSRLSTDTAIGLLFVGMLALGVVIVSRSGSFAGDLTNILFGEILATSDSDLLVQLVVTVGVAVVTVICARAFLLLSISAEQAQVAGFRSAFYHAVMLALIALTVVVSFTTVGTLLVFGMLLAPAGVGALVARRVPTMMGVAVGVGAVSVVAGLLLSYHFDLAAGATMVLVAVGIFFLTLVVQGLRRGVPAPREEHHH
jgi:ABC-type Mn2+/Zn2+ transport system permease subunit